MKQHHSSVFWPCKDLSQQKLFRKNLKFWILADKEGKYLQAKILPPAQIFLLQILTLLFFKWKE